MFRHLALGTLVAAVAALAPLAAANAEQHGMKLEEQFKQADKDNDGSLDKEEAKAMPRVAKHFDAIDKDKGGTVTLEEIRASMKGKAKEMHQRGVEKFKAADKDSDGSLDKEEAKAMPRVANNFDAIDADKSGTVTEKEIHDFMNAHRGDRMKEMHQRGVEKFKAADKDSDGSLDKEEAKAMPRVAKNFDAIDADKSGTVTEKEIHDFMKSGRGDHMMDEHMKDGHMEGGKPKN